MVIRQYLVSFPDRYRSLPSEVHQLQFVGLQRDLLLDFLHDLAATGSRTSATSSLSPLLCAHLNGCSYVATVIREWGEMKASGFLTTLYRFIFLHMSRKFLYTVYFFSTQKFFCLCSMKVWCYNMFN